MRRSKSACDVAILVAVGIPDVFVEDGSGGELGDFGILGLGTDAIALPMRDLGLLLAVLSDKLEHPSKAHQVNHHAAQKLNHSMRAALRFCL